MESFTETLATPVTYCKCFRLKTKNMNRSILILAAVLIISTQYLYAQSEIPALPKKKNVRSGTVYFINGETKDFKKLNFLSDNVIIIGRNKMVVTESLAGIDHIDGRVHRPGMAALIGGISGIAVGVIAGGIAYPDRSFVDWLVDEINDENEGNTIKKEEVPIILGCAVAGAGIGAAGRNMRKEKNNLQAGSRNGCFSRNVVAARRKKGVLGKSGCTHPMNGNRKELHGGKNSQRLCIPG